MAIIAVNDCGCAIDVYWNDDGQVNRIRMIYCPLHSAAEKMQEALKDSGEAIETLDKKAFGLEPGELYWYRNTLLEKISHTLALADGEKEGNK